MSVTISGTNGIDKVQDGTIQSADFAAGVPGRSNLPAGTVLQVVNATTASAVTSTSATYVDTTLTASITPTSATSKILIFVSQNGLQKNNVNGWMGLKLLRNSTDLIQFEKQVTYTGTTVVQNQASSTTYLDSPATTSSVTYKTQFNSGNSNSMVVQASNEYSSITLMEIAA